MRKEETGKKESLEGNRDEGKKRKDKIVKIEI